MAVQLSDEQDDPLEPGPLVELAELVLTREGCAPDAQLAITMVDRDEIARLNAQYLSREGPTDVLAFPIEQLTPGAVPPPVRGQPPLQVGDVVICPSVVREQAASAGTAFEDELSLMVVHGILHLLGYDHEDAGDAELMEQRERELLGAVGMVRP